MEFDRRETIQEIHRRNTHARMGLGPVNSRGAGGADEENPWAIPAAPPPAGGGRGAGGSPTAPLSGLPYGGCSLNENEEALYQQHKPLATSGVTKCFKFNSHGGCAAGATCKFDHSDPTQTRGGTHYTVRQKTTKWGGPLLDEQGRPAPPITAAAEGQKEMAKLRQGQKLKTAKKFQEVADRAKKAADVAAQKNKAAQQAQQKASQATGEAKNAAEESA
jgi:hypothetical protein